MSLSYKKHVLSDDPDISRNAVSTTGPWDASDRLICILFQAMKKLNTNDLISEYDSDSFHNDHSDYH